MLVNIHRQSAKVKRRSESAGLETIGRLNYTSREKHLMMDLFNAQPQPPANLQPRQSECRRMRRGVNRVNSSFTFLGI